MTKDTQPLEIQLYESRKKVHPRDVKGTFQTLRKISIFVLLGIFYLLPWLNFDGHQAVLFDLPARKFTIFAITFWPQHFIYLSWLLIIAAFGLFFVTALAGRVWCGFACPQTVWTELFVRIEFWIEGSRNKRIKLDERKWDAYKIRTRGLKIILWALLALWTGFTFVGWNTLANGAGTSYPASNPPLVTETPYMHFDAENFNDSTNAWTDLAATPRNISGTTLTSSAGNIRGNPTKVTYYQATSPVIDEMLFVSDVGGDLASKYMLPTESIS